MDILLVFRTVRIAFPDHQLRQKVFELLRGKLLLGIAERTGRIAMRLYHQTVKAEIQRCL